MRSGARAVPGKHDVAGTRDAAFGNLLKQYRRDARLSQEQLAERAGLSTQAISALERGVRQAPYRDTVRMLADALGLQMEEREHLHAAVSRGRAAPVAPVAARRALPLPLTPLIGREADVVALRALAERPEKRLLTVLGAAGVGKTSLAIQTAASLLESYADGVVFVPLAPLRDCLLVPAAIMEACGIKEQPGVVAMESLISWLRDRHALLVLDNFEHLLPAAALMGDLLAACAGLNILTTSRAPLRLRGEHRYLLEPLAVPAPSSPSSLEDLAAVPAVTLLVRRTQAYVSGWQLTQANAESVAGICRRLEGIPLALELAATRLTVLSPALLLRRLAKRLPVLTGGPVDLPARQQTLRATLAWSYDLLLPDQQLVFRHLAVLPSGCDLEAAEMLFCDSIPRERIMDILSRLIEASLLRSEVDPTTQEARFVMLETMREFGLELLAEQGELEHAEGNIARYYLHLVEAAEPQLRGADQRSWRDRFDREQDNLRAALGWARDHRELACGLRMSGAMWRYWHMRGHMNEGRRWLHELLDLDARFSTDISVEVRAKALHAAAGLAWAQSDHTAASALAGESLALHRASGNQEGVGFALRILALIAKEQSNYPLALQLHGESLACYRSTGNQSEIANTLHNLGAVNTEQGDYHAAQAAYAESLTIVRALDDRGSVALSLNNLGDLAERQGDYERAWTLCRESLALHRELGVMPHVAASLQNLGIIAMRMGDLDTAETMHLECLAVAREHDMQGDVAFALCNLADIFRARGRDDEASAHYRESLILSWKLGLKRGVAFSLEGLAAIAAGGAQPVLAARLYGAAAALRAAIGAPLAPVDLAEQQNVEQKARAALGAETYETFWRQAGEHELTGLVRELLGAAQTLAPLDAYVPMPAGPAGAS
jgi:predicted ATPase/DNA-binding XRE family transcriptional regulator